MHPIKTKTQFIKILQENRAKNVIIHYRCAICEDEQVTYEEEAEDILETFEEYEYLVTGYNCTSCGMNMKMIHVKDIFGIEIMENK